MGADVHLLKMQAGQLDVVFAAGDASQVDVGFIGAVIHVQQLVEILLGLIFVLVFPAQQGQGQYQVAIQRKVAGQAVELLLRCFQLVLLHQVAGIGYPQTFVLGPEAGLLGQVFHGLVVLIQGDHGLGAGQDGTAVAGGEVQCPIIIPDGLLMGAVHGFQGAFGVPELVVVDGFGVLGQLQQNGLTGLLVGGAGGLQQVLEIHLAAATDQLIDLGHGLIQLAKAD